MSSVSKAQVEHVKELILGFNTLISDVKRHDAGLVKYANHCYNVFVLLEEILDQRKGTITPVVEKLKENILKKSKHFDSRSNAIFDQLSKTIKGIQKTIKEREFLGLDFTKYNSQKQKYYQERKTGYDDSKKTFENEQKLIDVQLRIEKMDAIFTNELPTLLILFNKIAELLSILICCYVHDIYETMYECFWCTKKMFPSVELDNLSFQKLKNDIKSKQLSIIETIESFKLFTNRANINVFADSTKVSATLSEPTKFGTALYSFKGEKEQDLSFNKGDVVRVVEETQDGWWKGVHVVTGNEGVFPYNYFKF